MELIAAIHTALPAPSGTQIAVAMTALVGLVLASVAIARDVAVRRLDISQSDRAHGGIA